jgi:hypothetical protein
LNVSGTTTLNSANIANNINITGATNAAQSLYFRSTDYNLGIAGGTGHFSSSAIAGDMILRTLVNTRLILQSGSTSYGLLIDTNNYVSIYKQLLMNIPTSETRAVTESRIFSSLPIITGAFGGDNYLSGYWGVAIGLNAGGWANGQGGGNNTQSVVSGQSAFTVNMRSSTSATSFDKTLFTVYPSGLVYINGVDNSYIRCGPNTNGYYLNEAVHQIYQQQCMMQQLAGCGQHLQEVYI